MFISIMTTHQPATDLGFLLMKHPDRVHEVELSFGRAVVFFPVASTGRAEAVLVLDVDPVGLVRGRGSGDGLLDQYVNDRPYAASSFLSVALNKVFRSAMSGTSRERQYLADGPIPLEINVRPLPVRGSDELVRALFEPLGWSVVVDRIPGTGGQSQYVDLRLSGNMRLADALTHLYVLIPVLDKDKHYWIGDDEVEKLLGKGEGWLASHPERSLIAGRYLKNREGLVRAALARLAPDEASADPLDQIGERQGGYLECPIRLHDLRLDAVATVLRDTGASAVADLGCGEGKLLSRLVLLRQFEKIIGLDASARSLDRAAERLKLGKPGGPKEGRVNLLHGSLTYRDERWHGAEVAALVEVVEHLDPNRLPALEEVVFGAAQPKTVVVTTPNADYNKLFPTLPAATLRHADHRFEWNRMEFRDWAARIEDRFGYTASLSGIGETHPEHGHVTQMAVFTR